MSIMTYSNERMGKLKQLLINNTESGKPTDYEIRVDDMRVVPRSNDPDQFDNHEEFVTEETRKVVVIIYEGNSRRNTRHTFLLKDEKKEQAQQNTLSGTDVEKIVSEKLKQEKKEWKYELLEKENKDLKEKLSEADDHFGKMAAAIENLKSKRKIDDLQWGELIGIAGESILRRNTHLIAKVPGMQGLAGILEKDNTTETPQQVVSPQPEVEASFTMKKENENEEKEKPELSKEEKDRIDFLKQLQERFSEEELRQVLTLLNLLVEKPKAVEAAIIQTIQWKEQPAETKTKTEAPQQENKTEKPDEKIFPEQREQISKEENLPEENKSVTEESSEDELKEHTF